MGQNSSRSITINTKTGPVEEFEIGTYRELKARSKLGDGLDIHHLMQKQIGLMYIPGYSPEYGICIALQADQHRKIPTLTSNEINWKYRGQHPRHILADNILRDRSAGVIPVNVLIEALRLHVRHYPDVYERPGDSQTQVNSQLDSVIVKLENQMTDESELQARGRWALTKGNRLNQLPEDVRKYLRNGGKTSESRSTTAADDNDGTDSRSYVIHEAYDHTLGRNLTCTVRREFLYQEVRTEQHGKTTVTIITRYYRLVIQWS
jgi:hypothetical protein